MPVPTTAGIVGIGMLVTGAVMGSVLCAACVQSGPAPVGMRERCGVSLVFFEPDDAEGKIIDKATGGLGYSHVAIDGCEVDDGGAELLIDCLPGAGVIRRPAAEYGDQRRRSYVALPLVEGRELYGCARGRIGVPYNLLGLVVPKSGPRGGLICSQLVWECLPLALRDRVSKPERRPIAPNDIAAAFDLSGPDGPDSEIE